MSDSAAIRAAMARLMIQTGYRQRLAAVSGVYRAAGRNRVAVAYRAYDRAMPVQRRTPGKNSAWREHEFLQVQTTTDSRAEAVALAQAAVETRLAACAQVAGPIASTYWWEEGIERAEEWLLMLKLPADRFDDLAAFLADRHSYDEPEIIAVPIVAGSPGYLDWLQEETRPE